MKPTRSQHEARLVRDAEAFYIRVRGVEAAAIRRAAIEALPTREWKGHTLRTIRCTGTTGKGPHDMHVAESLCWSLMDLRDFRCPYHPR